MKLDALEHPKTLDLASQLGVSRPTVLGHLELLWAFTGKHSAQGDIGKWPDGAIARACEWMGDPKSFLQSLLQSGFIDPHPEHRYVIHDWHEHAPRWVRAKLAKASLEFVNSVVATVVRTIDDTADDDNDDPEEGAGTVEPTVVATTEASSKGSVVKGSEAKSTDTSASPPAPAEQVFRHWQAEWKHPNVKLDPKRRKRIEARLKDFTAEQLCQAISGYKHSPWHTGADPKGQGVVYDGIQTLLQDSEHVETGLQLFAHPPRPPPKVEQLSPVERVLRANGVNRDDRVVAEQFGSGNAGLGDPDGDVRKPAYSGFRRLGS